MNQLVAGTVTVLTAIIGVAILAVLVSRQNNTSGVLQAGGNAFASMLNAATSPGQGGGLGNLGNLNNVGIN